jgi:hypothetical protein
MPALSAAQEFHRNVEGRDTSVKGFCLQQAGSLMASEQLSMPNHPRAARGITVSKLEVKRMVRQVAGGFLYSNAQHLGIRTFRTTAIQN